MNPIGHVIFTLKLRDEKAIQTKRSGVMIEYFQNLLNHSDFVPRPACGGWTNGLIYLHNISDALIWLSYMTIPVMLIYFIRKHKDWPFRHVFWLFGTFIITCGFTHFLDILTFYVPYYRLSGLVKLITALASAGTAIALIPIIPKALALRSPQELEREIEQRKKAEEEIRQLNQELEQRVKERTAELEAQIIERKKTEMQLRQVIESVPNAIIMSNEHSTITLVNNQAENMFGYHRNDLIGQPIDILVPERFRTQHPQYQTGFLHAPESRAMGAGRDLYALKKDGAEIPVEIGLNPIQTDQGIQVLSAIVDITERKKSEKKLEAHAHELARSNEELEQFAYVASHDLLEPLRMVSSYVQLLQQRYQDKLDQDANEFIHFAVDGATRMQTLISDLLAFSRVGTRGNPFQLTNVQDVLDQVCTDLQFVIADHQAQIIYQNLPTIMADKTQLAQVFQNLISNAIKFRSDEQPLIQITAKQQNNDWLFTVTDNGIGIDPKFTERIFVIFQRLHTRDKYPGTGIGLAVCKKIVERHGGHIWFESNHPQGTKFLFTLPKRSDL